MLSALLMIRRLAEALRVALREEDFGRILSAGLLLIIKVFTAGYVLVGIGILVEVARRLGMGFMTARAELSEAKAAAKSETSDRT
jgi:hypothetical protein